MGLLVLIVFPQFGEAQQAPDFSNKGYDHRLNPFDRDQDPLWYECTRYAWGRAYERTGIQTQFTQENGRHGGEWYRLVRDLPRGSEPRSNSFVVWDYPPYGHVAYVESVSGDNIVISEANWSTNGRYNGFKTFTRQSIQNRGSYKLVGFIYLQSVDVSDFWQKTSNGQYTISGPTDNLVDAQFKLVNNGPSSVMFSQVAMALHRESDRGFVADVGLQHNVTVPAGGTYQFPQSLLDGTNPNLQPGKYRLVAKDFDNGAWTELSLHLPFTIVSRSNNCGVSTVTDPQITALANTNQPVRWFYFLNQSTGNWYMVSPTGEQVMFLDKIDNNTAFGVYWRPVNNSSFQTYPDMGRNFSAVTISADGHTIYFGSPIAASNDPHVSALANSTQPVRWSYIMNESTSRWYIVSPTGQQVMLLDRLDQNTSFGIYWKPINNSSFMGYATAGQNYSSITVSSDGRSISFGSLR